MTPPLLVIKLSCLLPPTPLFAANILSPVRPFLIILDFKRPQKQRRRRKQRRRDVSKHKAHYKLLYLNMLTG